MLQIAATPMKPGDRVIWLYSPGSSFLSGWRLEEIPGVVLGICRHRIWIRVRRDGKEKSVSVDPENVTCAGKSGERTRGSKG